MRSAARLEASAVPASSRDGFAVVLGLAAVVLLVAQHWLAPGISSGNGRVTVAGPATIALSAPLALVAAGTVAATSVGRLGGPLRRLILPVVPFAVIAVPLIDGAGRLLWLPAALALVTAMTPALVRLHRRWRGAEVVALAAVAIGLDVVRFGLLDGSDAAGGLSVLAGWVVAYQIGVVVAAGVLDRMRGRTALTLSAAGFAVAALAMVVGAIGTPGSPPSQIPSAGVLLAVTAGQVGLALAARPVIGRWAAGVPVAHGLAWLSRRLLTIYLWHLPALAVVSAVAVLGFGYEPPAPFGDKWRADLPWWLLCTGATLAVFMHAFGRVERLSVGTALLRSHQLTGSSTLGEHERLKA